MIYMFWKVLDFEMQHNPVYISFTQFNLEVVDTPFVSWAFKVFLAITSEWLESE